MALSVETAVGQQAPAFELTGIDGQRYALRDALATGPALVAFFKETCPICMLAWPFVERLHQAYTDKGLQVLGVSQGGTAETEQWKQDYAATHPLLVDEGLKSTVAYGLEFVPSLFLIARDGSVRKTQVGWSKAGFEELSREAASLLGVEAQPIVRAEDDVPDSKAG